MAPRCLWLSSVAQTEKSSHDWAFHPGSHRTPNPQQTHNYFILFRHISKSVSQSKSRKNLVVFEVEVFSMLDSMIQQRLRGWEVELRKGEKNHEVKTKMNEMQARPRNWRAKHGEKRGIHPHLACCRVKMEKIQGHSWLHFSKYVTCVRNVCGGSTVFAQPFWDSLPSAAYLCSALERCLSHKAPAGQTLVVKG